MKGRVNKKVEGPPVPREPETVMTFTSVVDPDLNPPTQQEPPAPSTFPRPDDPSIMVPFDSATLRALHSSEKLIRSEDIPEGPIKEAFEGFEQLQNAKRSLLERANKDVSEEQREREYYLARRKRRAVPIPSLPSMFAPYPAGVSVSYSPYSVRDIENINNNDIPLQDKYTMMLEGIYTEGMSPLELTFSDFSFIGDTRHIQSMGDATFKYPYVCSVCGNAGLAQFNLTDVSFSPLAVPLPIHVRFHTFPDDTYAFVPHTIGDVMHLLKSDRYWRKLGDEYVRNEAGDKLIDIAALNACRCISHPWQKVYFDLLEASEDPRDRVIMRDIGRALYHGTEPIKFRCNIPLDRGKRREMAEVTSNIVTGVVSGELSTTTPNDPISMPKFMEAHMEAGAEVNTGIKVCGAENTLDVLVGDILIPFRRLAGDMEYGILSR